MTHNARDGKSPAYLWYPGDWLSSGSVRRMTRWEQSCYRDLLDHDWLDGGIPDNGTEVAHLLREDPRRFLKSWPRIRSQFVPHSSRAEWLVNPRVQKEREVQALIRAEKVAAGRLGASARWKTDGTAIISPMAKNGSSPAPAPAPSPWMDPSTDPAGDKPPRVSKPRKAAVGPNADLIRHWEQEWPRTRMGQEWAWTPKEAVGVANALKLAHGDVGEVRNRMTRLLESPDAWLAANASPTTLVSRWNQLAVSVRTNGRGNVAEQMLRDRIEKGTT